MISKTTCKGQCTCRLCRKELPPNTEVVWIEQPARIYYICFDCFLKLSINILGLESFSKKIKNEHIARRI